MDTSILFLIPARGGSKGLPGKNVRPISGLPMVGWAARNAATAARLLGGAHAVVCSTDDDAIAEAARAWGAEVPFTRPAELASDTADTVDVVLHAADWLAKAGRPFDTVCLVQPTSPLALPEDLAAAVRAFRAGDGTPVVSTSPAHPPQYTYRLEGDRIVPMVKLEEVKRRQDAGTLVSLNGAVYVIGLERLRRTRKFVDPDGTRAVVMPVERNVDVDTAGDLALAEALLSARAPRPFSIAGRPVGPGARCFVIAEAGVNHNGDMKMARQLIDVAREVGADAVKFQTFDPALLAADSAPKAKYQEKGSTEASQKEMLAKLALTREAHHELKAYAEQRGIMFLSSPFDEGSADFLASMKLPALKIPSGEVTNHPYLQHIARLGIPMLMSTGMCTLAEVGAAVEAIRAAGDPPLALFHCLSNYPAPAGESNLRAMATLAGAFGVPVGWSDHTPGVHVSVAAVAMGAALIEKHLTLDHALPGPDHRASLEPQEFRELVEAIRATESALGDGVKAPRPCELEIAAVARKSLHWRTDVASGARVEPAHLISLRPGTGIPPARLAEVVGRRLKKGVRSGAMLTEEDLEAR